MKPIDVKSSTYIDLSVGNNDKDPKFKLFDHERILKYEIYLQVVTLQIFQKNFLCVTKVENTVQWAYVINDLTR